ncbi:MAG: glycosyltransferase family 2 protein [Ignavibacteriae bacterium]|nr:glycosyltransferase family 2 protein [Ignavibacteriota bacterium]
MLEGQRVGVVIPALNEERSIASVIADLPSCVDEVVLVDNGSTDRTSERARSAGAIVLHEPRRGYGYACLRGIDHLRARRADIVVFIDGDYSDYPEDLSSLISPVARDRADFVIGSRMIGEREVGAMLPHALFGNWLATALIRIFWSYRFTDLGPFRAIRMASLQQLQMRDCTYGWTVEMQIKAAKHKLRCVEVPVRYRKRIGKSKITGTVSGTVKASAKILYTIFRYALSS